MDAYEATRIVFSRIQNLDPEHAPKIMGLLLLQEHGEKEMIRLAFGPESLLRSLVLKAWKELGLVPDPSSSAPCTPFGGGSSASPFLLRQNSASRLPARGLPSPLAVSSPSSWRSDSSSGCNGLNGSSDEFQNSDELMSPGNLRASPFYGVGGDGGDLIDEFHRSDQLSFLSDAAAAAAASDYSYPLSFASKHVGDVFQPDLECRSPSSNGDCTLFPYGVGSGVDGYYHRRSCSAADLGLGDPAAGFGWRPCLYFARGYCKNGTACRFLHGLPEEAVVAPSVVGGTKMDAVLEQQCQELLLRSKSQRIDGVSQLMASAFPYSQTGSVPPSPSLSSSNSLSFLLQQQQQNESQRATAVAAAAALMLGGDDTHKFVCRSRFERNDLMANPGSRQIYLTFPADSIFSEEDVSNYFSIYGPVHDVRIPYQQKRMFGFVTFVYPETVKLILAKGNPHFVCDSRVLVKPYKEKGKVPDKKQQQHAERGGDFSMCMSPTALDATEAYDLQQLGARRLYNGSSQELLLRRKLMEQQQQAAELQRAIELQGSRFMNLQLNLNKSGLSNSPAIAVTQSLSDVDRSSNTSSSSSSSHEGSPTEEKSLGAVLPEEKPNSSDGLLQQKADKEESAGEPNPKEDGDFQPSIEHNLPDSPFASPTKSSSMLDSFTASEDVATSYIVNNSSTKDYLLASTLLPTTLSLDMPSFSSCFFQMPSRFSGQGEIGM
ncbi:zinc finger CCCH domain-containing protein 53-like isoform X3 [Musa acuminata AAA Group]|uniref:zinc finger CCCH domain-containing protein 53 isoform X3 n=1 Tax=Musa acuminata AAA Group TaxID=214697 RepID=UPI0031D736F7